MKPQSQSLIAPAKLVVSREFRANWTVTKLCHHDLEKDFPFNFEQFGVHVVYFKGWSEGRDRDCEQPWWIKCLQVCSACCHCFAFAQALIAVLNVILINHIDTGQQLTCCKSFKFIKYIPNCCHENGHTEGALTDKHLGQNLARWP